MGQYEFLNQNEFSVHQKIIKLVGKHKIVLDVGCSVGTISESMKMNKCLVTGIEMDEKSAEKAKSHCMDVYVGDVESIELDNKYNNYFDFLIFADVLEHLRDPEKVLRQFKKYLKDDGYIIISLPNVANWRMRIHLLMGNFEYKDYGLLDKGHLRFFNFKNSKKLIEDAGFEIIRFDMTVGDLNNFAKFFNTLGRLWPNLLAFQFLFYAKKCKDGKNLQ